MSDFSTPHSLGYVVYSTSLPSGEVGVILDSVVQDCGGALILQTQITVESLGASEADLEALKTRVSPHLQIDWQPHCRPDSWTGAVYGGAQCASDAIEALGDLEVDLDWSDYDDADELMYRTTHSLRASLRREAHEGMRLRSLGLPVEAQTQWALENVGAL